MPTSELLTINSERKALRWVVVLVLVLLVDQDSAASTALIRICFATFSVVDLRHSPRNSPSTIFFLPPTLGFRSFWSFSLCSRPQAGDDLNIDLRVSFFEAVNGCEKDVTYPQMTNCSPCKGSGVKSGSTPTKCSQCNGSGYRVVSMGRMTMQATCSACDGSGKYVQSCNNCGGQGQVRERKTVRVSVPAGIESDTALRMPGLGDAGRNGGRSGSLYVKVTVMPHPTFKRQGKDVHLDVSLPFTKALLGGVITVPTLSGDTEVVIDACTQPGSNRVLRNRGIRVVNRNTFGDFIIHFNVTLPKSDLS